MKKSDKLARKTRKMIAKNLIVLATLAVVAFAGVMSWFTQNTRAIADGINVETKVEDGLEFYIMPPSDSDQYAAIKSRFKDNAEILESVQAGSREFAHELADVFSYLLTLADSLGIDLADYFKVPDTFPSKEQWYATNAYIRRLNNGD